MVGEMGAKMTGEIAALHDKIRSCAAKHGIAERELGPKMRLLTREEYEALPPWASIIGIDPASHPDLAAFWRRQMEGHSLAVSPWVGLS